MKDKLYTVSISSLLRVNTSLDEFPSLKTAYVDSSIGVMVLLGSRRKVQQKSLFHMECAIKRSKVKFGSALLALTMFRTLAVREHRVFTLCREAGSLLFHDIPIHAINNWLRSSLIIRLQPDIWSEETSDVYVDIRTSDDRVLCDIGDVCHWGGGGQFGRISGPASSVVLRQISQLFVLPDIHQMILSGRFRLLSCHSWFRISPPRAKRLDVRSHL